MIKVLDILHELEATTSKNKKIEILTKHANNSYLWDVIKLALDPFTQFYIRKIPVYTHESSKEFLDDAFEHLEQLSSRKVTGNKAIDCLTYILSNTAPDDAQVIERIISKDLKCGVNIGTVNKVKPNFIFEYPVMLCSKLEQRLLDKFKFPAIVQHKLDGMRFNAIVKSSTNTVEFRSRSGKILDFNGLLEQDFLYLAFGKDVVYDGELLIAKPDNTYEDRKVGNGILSRANKGKLSVADSEQVRVVLWDNIPYDDFIKHKSKVPYMIRFTDLSLGLSNYSKHCGARGLVKRIQLADTDVAGNLNDVYETFKIYLDQGHEGIILKEANGIWEFNRVQHQIKFKGELECDLEVIDWVEGSNKYEGLLGALVCSTEDGILKVSVGSGFSDLQRQTIDRSIIGKIITVKYNERITNKAGDESLFLPIFIEIREDKTVANTILELE